MAESYRGLTIRIGGDTTGLQKALKTSTSAIQGADMELRKLGQALKLDPGNVEAFNLQVGYLGDKATSTAMKLYQMQQAAEQIRGKEMKFVDTNGVEEIKVIGEIAKETENVHLQAEKAKASYNKIRDELHGMYNRLTEYNQEAAESGVGGQLGKLREELEDALDGDDIAKSVDAVIERIKTKFNDLDGIVVRPEGFDAMVAKLKEYAENFSAIEDEAQKNIVAEAFKQIAQDITTATAQVINFDSAWTTPEKIKELREQFVNFADALELDPKKIDEFFDKISEHKKKFVAAEDTLQIQNEVARLADLDVEIERAKSSVTNLAKALASMDVPSELMRRMNDLTEKADAYKKAVSESMSRASTAAGEYKLNGDDATRSAAMNEYANAIKNAKSQLETLNEQMNRFNPEEVERWSGMTETATQQLVKASVAHADATKNVKLYEGAVEGAYAMLDRLSETASREIRILDKDEVIAADKKIQNLRDQLISFDEDTEQARESIKKNLIESLEKFVDAAKAAGNTDLAKYFADTINSIRGIDSNFKGLAEAEKQLTATEGQLQEALRRKDWEGRRNEVMAAKKAIDEATVAEQKFAAGDFKMDTKWIDDLKSVKSDLESVGSTVAQGFQPAIQSISALDGVASKATISAKALIDAFAVDMSNTDALRLGVDSLKESLVAGNTKAALLRDTLAQYTPDKIDEVAIAAGKVGANVAQSAAEMNAAFKNLDDAKKKMQELEEQKKKALAVKTDQSEIDQLNAAIEVATEEVNKWGAAAMEATDKFNLAKSTQEFVELRNEAAKTDAELDKFIDDAKAIADSFAKGETANFAKRVFGDTDKELEGLKSAFDTAVSRYDALTKASAELPGNTELATKKQNAYNEAVAAGKAYGDRLKQSMQMVSDSIDPSKIQALKDEFNGSLDVAAASLTNEMRNLVQQISALDAVDDADLLKSLNDRLVETAEKAAVANAALHQMNDQTALDGIDTSIKNAGKSANESSAAFEQMFSRITQYAERAASAIVESASTIDAAYRDMRKTVNGTEEDFEHLRDAAIEFSQTHAVSADTILEMESLGGQLGVTVEALEEFGRVASNLDIATNIDANDIALQLGQITNVMSDLDFTTFEQFGDALVRLGNNVAAQESSIMAVAQRMSAVANVTSMTTPQLLGWSAAIASTGQRSEAAATAISNTITGIGKAVAAGGDKLEAFAKIAQMSADDFKAAWESSSSDALEAFIKGLSTLTDNSTDAIEALDSVGIKAVRQENNILALSQTIDNLDKSITMATDAFNGIGDQWGAAGDAAREADQKSQGFSGTLQILKNNLANLAESFGDAFVLPMQLASEAIKGLTTLMNAVPAVPMVVVALTGLVAIGGTTIKTLNDVTTALKNLAAGQAGTAVAGLVTKMEALVASTTGATGAALGLGTALATGIAVTGIGLAVAAIGALATAMIKAHDDAVKLREAKERLKTSSERLKAAAAGATSAEKNLADGISAVKMTAEDTAAYVNKLAEAQERLAEEFEDQNYSLEVDTKSAEDAFAKIQALMEKADGGVKLNPFDQAELEGAVAVLNETMGTGLEVIDASKAAIKGLGDESAITADKLRAMVDAEIESATRALLVQQYVEEQQELLKAEDALNKAKQDAADNERAYAEAMKATGSLYANGMVPSTKEAVDANLSYIQTQKTAKESQAGLNEAITDAQDIYDTHAESVKLLYDRIYSLGTSEDATVEDTAKLAEALEKLFGKSDALRDCLTRLGADLDKYDFGKLAEDFAEAGVSAETFANITDEQLSRIMGNYNGTASSIKRSCQEMGIALGNLVDGMEDVTEASEEMRKATDEEYEHFKDLYDELYTQQKRIREDFYNDEKKRREKAQDDLKDELDHEQTLEKRRLEDKYNDRKKTYDRDYEAAKDLLDKKYDDFKDELDSEYTLEKRRLDDIYDARKDAYDKEYDALKDALDKEYDTVKDTLDKEYDAYKKSLDKQYNAVKDAYDEIYNARKEELDKEYELYKDQLDDQYDLYKKQLDKELDALKNQLDDVYDKRKDELDREYDLYKKELDAEYKARKKVLDKEYDAVKDQLDDVYDARKKELDAEYKAEQKASSRFLKQYKKTLTAQTDEFKKATKERVKALEAERDAQKALIDEQTKAKTDELDRRIAALRGETDAENREQRERERADKKAELQKAVDSAKSRKTRAEAKKELNDYLREIALEDAQERREQLVQELEDERDALEERGDQRKEMLDEQYAHEVEQYEAARELELEVLQENLDEQYEKMQDAESARLELIKESQSKILETLKEEQTGQLELIKEAQSESLEALKEEQSVALEGLKSEHDAILETLKGENDAALEAAKEANNTRLEAMKDENDARLESMKSSHDAQLEGLKAEHDAALESLKDENDALLEAMKDDHEAQLETFKDNNDAQLEAMKGEHEAALKVLKRENEDSLAGLKKEHETRLEAMKDENETSLKAIKDDHEAQLLTLKRENEDGLETLKRDHSARIESLKEQDEADLLFLKRAHEDELKRIKDNYDETLRGIKAGTVSYQEAMAQITGESMKTVVENEGTIVETTKETAKTVQGESAGTKKSLLDHLNEVTGILPKQSTENKNTIVKNWNEIGTEVPKKSSETKKSVISDAESINKDGSRQMDEFGKNVISGFTESAKTVGDKSKEAKDAALGNMSEMEKGSSTSNENIKNDTDTKFGEYKDIVAKKSGEAKDELEGNVGEMENAIGNTDLAGSVQGPLVELENVIRNLDTYNWGSDLMQNFARGMESASSWVTNVAQTVANNVSSWMGHSVPEKGEWHEGGKGEVVWGQDLMDNFIEGIVSREQALADALEGLAEVVEEKFDPDLPIDELDQYVAHAKTAYGAQENDLNRHAANVDERYAEMFDRMRRRLGEFADGYVTSDREMYAKSLALLNEHVDRTYEEHAHMYDRLETYTERYVDSIAAAYEAIDQITSGSIDRQVQVSVQGQSAQPVINVNVTLSDVTIRETADIDKLAQQLAKRVDQVTRSRIGR